MVEIGRINTLKVLNVDKKSIYFDGGVFGEIRMPLEMAETPCNEGDTLEVFVYPDSNDELVATTQQPYAMAGEFALLQVVSFNNVGAFLNWGLPKDLLVPFREQLNPMVESKSYVVFVFVDEDSNRMVASSKLEDFLENDPPDLEENDEVDLLIIKETDLGYSAIINNQHLGVLYHSEVFQPLTIGQRIKGYIRKLREDGKIDLILHPLGYEKVDALSRQILDKLNASNGFIALNDKSPTEAIYRAFAMSKKSFKMAIGALYKARLISIGENGIQLITTENDK